MNTDELTTVDEVETIQPEKVFQPNPKKYSFSCSETGKRTCHIFAYSVLLIAVIVIYLLHFLSPKPSAFIPKEITGVPGSGEIVYVNLDTINENYVLVKILTGDIKEEMTKQEAIFTNKENAFKKKYNQFMENMNAGILTQVQAENAQQQLSKEYQQLEEDKERVFDNLQSRQAAALVQIYDSLQAAVQRINAKRNASFVISYQNQSPFLLATDPAKDITDYVLFELNHSYKK
jgi:Skp family chaperone for outer membrane proteins